MIRIIYKTLFLTQRSESQHDTPADFGVLTIKMMMMFITSENRSYLHRLYEFTQDLKLEELILSIRIGK